MKSHPLILISGSTEARGIEFADRSLSLSLNYSLAIHAAGGSPWVLPCLPDREYLGDAVRRCAGVLLTGGDDVEPSLYTPRIPVHLQETVTTADPARDLFELMLIDEIFRQRKPLLAICRGQQILNVALGGTLLVDIERQRPTAMNHARMDLKNRIVHDVDVQSGSLLAQAVRKTRFGVNSSHHQAVEKVAKPLRAIAASKDGIVEGLELGPAGRHLLPYLLAVQFHPERLFARHEEHLRLFISFTRACRRSST
jgi:putative glutamine amidotransferase